MSDAHIYASVMVVSNVSNILMFILGTVCFPSLRDEADLTPFSPILAASLRHLQTCESLRRQSEGRLMHLASISSVMISRLMLNLRDPALSHMSGRLRLSTTITAQSLRFAPNQGVASPVLDTDATMDA